MTRAPLVAATILLIFSGRVAAQKDGPGGGTVKGRVVWAEKVLPERQPISVEVDKAHCLSKGNLFKDEWLVSPKSKGLRYVCVWLAPIDKEGKLPVPDALKKRSRPKVYGGQGRN